MKSQEIRDEIKDLLWKLHKTDYKALKYAEGELTAEEYGPAKTERRAWRERINELGELLPEVLENEEKELEEENQAGEHPAKEGHLTEETDMLQVDEETDAPVEDGTGGEPAGETGEGD